MDLELILEELDAKRMHPIYNSFLDRNTDDEMNIIEFRREMNTRYNYMFV